MTGQKFIQQRSVLLRLRLALLCCIASTAALPADDRNRRDVNEVFLSGVVSGMYVTAPGPYQQVVFHMDVNHTDRFSIDVACFGPDAIGFGCTDYVGDPALVGSRIYASGFLVTDFDGKLRVRLTVPPQILPSYAK